MNEEQKQVQKQRRVREIADSEKLSRYHVFDRAKDSGPKKATPTDFHTCRNAADLLSKEEGDGGNGIFLVIIPFAADRDSPPYQCQPGLIRQSSTPTPTRPPWAKSPH